MMDGISTKLTKRLDAIRSYPVGVSASDVAKLQLTEELIGDIFECLDSRSVVDKQMGLFFSSILIEPGKLGDLQEYEFVLRVRDLCRGETKETKPYSFQLLRCFRSRVPDYRDLMLQGLQDSDAMVRKEALLGYETYCRPKEITPLEAFERDEYLTETSMNGPLLYELRNLALETVERVIGRSFRKAEKTEATFGGEIAFCWDWAPYHRWKNHWWNRLMG